ncbi:MAG TPA: PQQ-dependent dehydrogenase, methanol/ethanol family [Steroidobacteraceae bacterium]|jgi:quinohemoprotein ethanol dehydrogenase|nr:PQQ-dependent dehydrogenase, methanol/ethanol family [Steroidobacteraceae bacterium]
MRSKMISVVSAALVAAAVLVACVDTPGGAGGGGTDPADLKQNEGQWLSYGRDFSEQRFSPLTQVNATNVSQLGLAWFGDLAERGGSYETTPLVVDGRIYVTSPWSKVYAYDAKTGKRLWKYDPQVPGEYAVKLCCGIVNRGVGYWQGKIIWGTLDGRLIAVDARTGTKVWEIQATDPKKWYSITGAPRIAAGRIFIGEAGSEFEERGYLACYSADNGKELWRWWTVPGDPSKGFEQPELAMAAKTWGGQWWKTGGGGTPWDGITYDPTTGYVFIGTGNGAPWPAEDRSPGHGDNLFTASVVAIDAKTGHYVWHYQETPSESFDFDSTAQITTADLTINGEKRHVVMHAPKNGIFYVLDAHTGKFISGTPFVPKVNWMSGFDDSGRPILNPDANYAKTGKGFFLVGFQSHVWNPMSFNPDTGLVYLPTNYGSYPYVAELGAKMGNQLLGINIRKRPEGTAPTLEGPRSYLVAWDPVKQKEAWRQTEGTARAGTMTTAGNLVFQGTANGRFNAYKADTGEKLWSVDTQATITGGPATYRIDDEQYVAVVAAGQSGFGGGGYWAPNYARLLVYKLGGNVQLPQKVAFTPAPLNPPPNFGDSAQHELGDKQYTAHCAGCHGNNQAGGRAVSSLFPDLRYAGALWSADAFKAIVLGGALQDNGMVSFAKVITPEDAEAIRSYVVTTANDAKNAPPAPPFGGPGGPGGAPPAAPAAPAAAPPPALHQ